MPIKVPDNLPALETLNAEQVDVIPQELAARQDIRPLKLLLLNLMPKKHDTEMKHCVADAMLTIQEHFIKVTPWTADPSPIRAHL